MSGDVTDTEPKLTQKLGFTRGVELVSAVVAPITIVTALLVHVGWTRNRAYFGYFGIDQGVLHPSVQDYVLRSVDVTFGAVARLVAVALALFILDRLLVHIIQQRSTEAARKWINTALAACGVILSAAGLLFALGFAGGLNLSPLLAATILGVGAVLTLRFGPTIFARNEAGNSLGWAGAAALYTILILALFWAATLYAQDLGQRAARSSDSGPSRLPTVTIFTDDYLDLPGSHVQASEAPELNGTSHYRYTGLFLLTYSNARWFLISGRYSDSYRSSVVVLPDSDSVRVEIAAAQ